MRYLIINFYSPLNLGDLAILEQTLWLVEQEDSEATFDVCVSDDSYLPTLPRVRWVRNWNFALKGPDRREVLADLRRAYASAGVILSLGGGYFFVHDHRPFSTWATLSLAYAVRQSKPVVCLPQSFGPFRHAYQARLAAGLMSKCATVMLRDHASMDVFARHARPARKAQFVPDTAFTMSQRWPKDEGGQPVADNRTRIGATVVDWSPVDPQLREVQRQYEQRMADVLRHAIESLGAEVTLFVQCQSGRRDFESDLGASYRMRDLVRGAEGIDPGVQVSVVEDVRSPREALTLYGRMNAFVCTRLHSAIFAACQGVPILGIGYQPKLRAVMQLLGQIDQSIDMRAIGATDLTGMFDRLWRDQREIGARLAAAARDLGRASSEAVRAAIRAYRSK